MISNVVCVLLDPLCSLEDHVAELTYSNGKFQKDMFHQSPRTCKPTHRVLTVGNRQVLHSILRMMQSSCLDGDLRVERCW